MPRERQKKPLLVIFLPVSAYGLEEARTWHTEIHVTATPRRRHKCFGVLVTLEHLAFQSGIRCGIEIPVPRFRRDTPLVVMRQCVFIGAPLLLAGG